MNLANVLLLCEEDKKLEVMHAPFNSTQCDDSFDTKCESFSEVQLRHFGPEVEDEDLAHSLVCYTSAFLPFCHANGGGADLTQKDAIESSATLLTFFVTK